MPIKLFREEHWRSPGFFKRQGALQLFKTEQGFRLYATLNPAAQGAVWTLKGSMEKLRVLSERIIDINEKIASEPSVGPHSIVFSQMPTLPSSQPAAVSNRRRQGVGSKKDAPYYRVDENGCQRPVKLEEDASVGQNTSQEATCKPKRKVRKAKRGTGGAGQEPQTPAVGTDAED